MCCAQHCPDRTEFFCIEFQRFGCGCVYHGRRECLPDGGECVTCSQRYEAVLQRECAARNDTINALLAELSGGPAAPSLSADDDDGDAEEPGTDDDADADDAGTPIQAAGVASPPLESILAELRDERQSTAEWSHNISK